MMPFEIHVADEVLEDLRSRLQQTRLPDQIPGSGHALGMDTAYLGRIIEYWGSTYDWRRAEQRLNSFDHHRIDLDGAQLHYVHARSPRPKAVPLLMLHGWPSSFVQMLDIIPLLTHPAEGEVAFDVVAVSLPGYGFSSIPTATGMNLSAMAPLMHRLMTGVLGYRQFGIRASDLGLGVANTIALADPAAVVGIHTSGTNPSLPPQLPDDLSPEEEEFVAAARAWNATEMAYLQLHASKPQTIGAALNDSPAGLAAWVGEKFWRWTDNHGEIEDAIGLDGFMTNLTIYWVTQTVTSSMRLYYEAFRDPAGWSTPQVPIGYLMADHDMFPTPRSWVERQGPVTHWTTTPRGGHFLEWEQPRTVADDLRSFFDRRLNP